MYFRAFLSLFFSSMKACAALGFLFGIILMIKLILGFGGVPADILGSFFVALVASIFGPFLAFPTILLSAPICVYLAKRSSPQLRDFIIASTLISSTYGLALHFLSTFDFALWFIAAGPLVGWFAWRDRAFYLKPKKDKSESLA